MENFTPLSALAGGLMIGVGAAILLLVGGRMAGVSGIVSGMLKPSLDDQLWRACFVAGLLAGAGAYAFFAPDKFIVQFDTTAGTVAAAGLMVGYGTQLGHGCTSGHGICGIGRLSLRSVVATALFVASAMSIVFITRHMMGEAT